MDASRRHVVQLYGEQDQQLAVSVCRYLAEGLDRDEGVVVIAAAGHLHAFARRLRQHSRYQAAVREGSLVLLDAGVLLAEILVDGRPDWERFERTVAGGLREVRAHAAEGRLRAYGEMVGLLWAEGQPSAAIRLEEHWNRLQASLEVDLYCAYPIDILGPEFRTSTMDPILCAHTHLLPGGGELASALDRAMDEVLGSDVKALALRIMDHAPPGRAATPTPEGAALWLRDHLPREAEAIVARARHYRQLT